MDNSNVVRVKPTELMFRNEDAEGLLKLAFVGIAAIGVTAFVIGYKFTEKVSEYIENKRNNNSTDEKES